MFRDQSSWLRISVLPDSFASQQQAALGLSLNTEVQQGSHTEHMSVIRHGLKVEEECFWGVCLKNTAVPTAGVRSVVKRECLQGRG